MRKRGQRNKRVATNGSQWLLICCALLCIVSRAVAQSGGRSAFAFLDVPVSPRIAGLGGKVATVGGLSACGAGVYNPAQLSPALHAQAEAAFSLYYAGVKYSNLAYFHLLPWGHMAGISARQMWYGSFTRRDEYGNEQGRFSAYDFTLSLHYAVPLGDNVAFGVSITPIYSQLEQYKAFGVVLDAALHYTSGDGLFTASLLTKNFGGTLKPYSRGHYAWAPFELLAGVSYTLENAPLRFIITLQHLENWDQRFLRADSYSDHLASISLAKHDLKPGDRIAAELLAHPIFAIEITPSRYFFLQLGYNPSRGQQLGLQGLPFIEGLSYGFGVHIRRFGLHFSRAHYHRAGATNHMSVCWRFGKFRQGGMRLSSPEMRQEKGG